MGKLTCRSPAEHTPVRECELLERASESIKLSHACLGTHLIGDRHRRIVSQCLLGTLGGPDYGKHSDALRYLKRECFPEFCGEKWRHDSPARSPTKKVDSRTRE